jgi:excisionase family DNA binding protein
MQKHKNEIELLTVQQVAANLGVSTKTIRRMIKNGTLHHHRVGRAVRVAAEDLRAYTNSIRQ